MQNEKNSNYFVPEVEISYKPNPNPVEITNYEITHSVLRHIWQEELITIQEQIYALFLNQNNQLLGYRLISTGTISSCQLDIRLLVSIALKTLATGVIIAHNHPSGNKSFSAADIRLTESVKKALDLFDIRLLDHFLLTEKNYVSFSKLGYL